MALPLETEDEHDRRQQPAGRRVRPEVSGRGVHASGLSNRPGPGPVWFSGHMTLAEERFRLREAAERVVHLYEAWNQPDRAAAWKAKLGMPDLPADVFARP